MNVGGRLKFELWEIIICNVEAICNVAKITLRV